MNVANKILISTIFAFELGFIPRVLSDIKILHQKSHETSKKSVLNKHKNSKTKNKK